MTRFLVSKLRKDAKEYEVDIAGNILRSRPSSYEEFHSQFTNWRSHGLYHALCLAARNMPRVDQWVPDSLLHESNDWQEALDRFNQHGFCSEHRITGICEALAGRSPAVCNHICSLLDKVAILTRVKSNPRTSSASCLLDDYLNMLRLPIGENSPYAHSLAVWGRLRHIIENAVPPSLMCPSLYPPTNRGAWGYKRLDLTMNEGRLCIFPTPLQWIDKDELCQKDYGERLPDRLYDILIRMGEAATSPEIAHLMLSPTTMSDCLAGNRVDAQSLPRFSDRNYVINAMREHASDYDSNYESDFSKVEPSYHPTDKLCDNSHFAEIMHKLEACMPAVGVRYFPEPLQLLAWRLDLPPRALLYRGSATELDLSKTPSYLLPKLSLQDRLQNRTISGVSMLPSIDSIQASKLESKAPETASLDLEIHDDKNESGMDTKLSAEVQLARVDTEADPIHTALRACIAEEIIAPHGDFANHPLHKVNVRIAPGKSEIHHTTTLAEAVNLFTGPRPFHISDVPLNESEPWNENHIDYRYAERQKAENGSRFRDWATLYHDEHEIQRCRMASHAVTCQELYETHFPLSTQNGYEWVSVASTIPAETRVLRHMGGNSNMEILRRSVESRFMHDGKLLPVRNRGDHVERTNMEIYTDHASGQVFLAYAPIAVDGSKKIEFMAFKHINAH